jgi:hypothetical protein
VGFVLAGIDDSGMLRIVVRVDATGIQGLFTADVRIDVAVGMAASVAGGAITLTPGTPAVTSTPTIHVTTLSYLLLAFAGTPIGPIMDQAISTIILSFFRRRSRPRCLDGFPDWGCGCSRPSKPTRQGGASSWAAGSASPTRFGPTTSS